MTRRTLSGARARAAVVLPVVGLLAGLRSQRATAAAGAAATPRRPNPATRAQTATFVRPVLARWWLRRHRPRDAALPRGGARRRRRRGREREGGAGGLTAANELFTAEPDGLTFGIFAAQGIVGFDLAEAEGCGLRLGAVHLRGPPGRGRRACCWPARTAASSTLDDRFEYGDATSTPPQAPAPPTTSTPTCCRPSSRSKEGDSADRHRLRGFLGDRAGRHLGRGRDRQRHPRHPHQRLSRTATRSRSSRMSREREEPAARRARSARARPGRSPRAGRGLHRPPGGRPVRLRPARHGGRAA